MIGGQTPDQDGDETDGLDEGECYFTAPNFSLTVRLKLYFQLTTRKMELYWTMFVVFCSQLRANKGLNWAFTGDASDYGNLRLVSHTFINAQVLGQTSSSRLSLDSKLQDILFMTLSELAV
jgi:hypothetical protein